MRKRGAALAAGSLLLGLGLVPVTSAASAAATASCRATVTFPDVWSGGFDFQFVITNTGTVPFNEWTVTWDMPPGDTIYTIWNGNITQQARHVVATSYGAYNTSVPPGGSVSTFGGVVEGSGGTGFTNITCTPGFAPVP